MIFKLLTGGQWRGFCEEGAFAGAPVDLEDGYIHFSTAAQVEETALKHFSGEADLVLVAVDPEKLGDALKYEASRGGALFPHYYGTLTSAHVAWSQPLPLRADGTHDFAGLLG